MHFVRADGDLLVSHAQIVVPDLERDGRRLRIAGVGGVMTYPQFRGEGHGTAVMRRTTDHILTDPSFDVGMLFCEPDVIVLRTLRLVDAPRRPRPPRTPASRRTSS